MNYPHYHTDDCVSSDQHDRILEDNRLLKEALGQSRNITEMTRKQRNELLVQRDQILAIHRPSTDHGEGWNAYCRGCWEAGGYDGAPEWPCATARALGGEA